MNKDEKILLGIGAIAIAGAVIYYLYQNSALGKTANGINSFLSNLSGLTSAGKQIQTDTTNMYNEIAGIGSQATKTLDANITAISSAWSNGIKPVQNEFGRIQQGFVSFGNGVTADAGSIKNGFAAGEHFASNIAEGAYKSLSSDVSGATKSVSNAWNTVTKAAANFGKPIGSLFSGLHL